MTVENMESYKVLPTDMLAFEIHERERMLNRLNSAKIVLEHSGLSTYTLEERRNKLSTELVILRGYLDERIHPTTTDESMD